MTQEGEQEQGRADDVSVAAPREQADLRKYEALPSRFLPGGRDLIVYLPKIYSAEATRQFPVLYLQDGQNLFDGRTSFVPGMDWHVGQTADEVIASGDVEPLIIVGIYHANRRRVEEYTPTRDRRLGGGKAKLYGRMLMEEIKPFIESEFRALPGPAHTGLGGSSLGALVALYLGLEHPEVFGRLAVLSPSVWWDKGFILRSVGRTKPSPRPKIWLDVGSREGERTVANVVRLRDALVAQGWTQGLDLRFEQVADGEHNEASWATRVSPFLRFLFPAAVGEL